MELLVDRFEARRIDVSVDLRRGDAGMPQHFLHLPEVGPAREQVRGEAMPQAMRAAVDVDFGADRVLLEKLPDSLAA